MVFVLKNSQSNIWSFVQLHAFLCINKTSFYVCITTNDKYSFILEKKLSLLVDCLYVESHFPVHYMYNFYAGSSFR